MQSDYSYIAYTSGVPVSLVVNKGSFYSIQIFFSLQ